MEAYFPNADKPAKKGDDSYLRWAYRSDEGNSAFIFINNYERLQNLTAKKNVQFDVCGVTLPKQTIPAGTMCIFPVNVAGIRYATAQLIARRDGKIYMEQIEGIPTDIAIDGKVLRNVKAKGLSKPVYKNIYLLNSHDAAHLFLDEPLTETSQPISAPFHKTKEAHGTRQITIGVNKVAEEPTDADFANAAVYTIDLPADREDKLMKINYQGDCARLYANGVLIDDNFYNGRPFLYGLWRLPNDVAQLELRILPMQENAPIYFPREADTTAGERVKSVTIEEMK